MVLDTEAITRLVALIISVGIHILLIYLTPQKLRELLNDLIKELLAEKDWKKSVIAAGLIGVFLLTFLTTFSLSTYSIANYILNDTQSVSSIPVIFKLTAVFLLILALGFIFDYMEGAYQETTERQAELLEDH